jgi:hypothetical protein
MGSSAALGAGLLVAVFGCREEKAPPDAPLSLEASLNALGVDITQTPRVAPNGEEVDDAYSPLGGMSTLDRVDELVAIGPRLSGLSDPNSRFTVFELVTGAPPDFTVDVSTFTNGKPDLAAAPWADSSGPLPTYIRMGAAGDFDGDGLEEIAVLHYAATGGLQLSLVDTQAPLYGTSAMQFPVAAPYPLQTDAAPDSLALAAGDFDGDGKAEITVFRPSTGTWWVRNVGSSNWGVSGDIPVRGDFDGDGKADVAIYRPSAGVWYIVNSSTMTWTSTLWGISTDIPVPGDYDGDGKTDIAIFRPSTGTWWILYSSNSSYSSTAFGAAGDIPVPGDYDGDGKTDIAMYRPSEGRWYIFQSSTMTITTRYWGASSDLAVAADYDGDGRTDIAVFRPSTGAWYIINSNSGVATTVTWGAAGDVPTPGDYDGDGRADVAIFRPSSGAWFIIQSSTGVGSGALWGISTDVPLLQRP